MMIVLTQLLKEQITLSQADTEFMYDAYTQMGLSKEWAIEDLQNLLEWLNGVPDTLTLYRLLYLNEGDEINKDQLDILNTLHNNIMYPHEQEITLKDKGKGAILQDIKEII